MFLDNGTPFSVETALGVIDFLRRHWVEEKGLVLNLSPCLRVGELPRDWAGKVRLQEANEVVWQSIRIDLTLSPEELRANLNSHWRRRLNQAEKSGMTLEVLDPDRDLDPFLERYSRFVSDKGFSWPSPPLVRELCRRWSGHVSLLRALHKGEAHAETVTVAIGEASFGLVLWARQEARQSHANNFLFWNNVIHHRKMGYRWLDLLGIDPQALPGITKFKRALGGDEYRLDGSYEARPARLDGLQDQAQGDYRRDLARVIMVSEAAPAEETAPPKDDVLTRVETIIAEYIRQAVDLELDTLEGVSLVEGNIIDSLSLAGIVQALMNEFEIEFEVPEMTLENFDNVSAITSLVRGKLADR
jgi:acyl carrier protein